MKIIKLFFFIVLSVQSSVLLATTFSLNPGWNLLGTTADIPVTTILTNINIKNVVIYQDGMYKASNNNEFTTVPSGSGFFVFSETSTTINLAVTVTEGTSTVTLAKVDGNGAELPNDATNWEILHVKDANLYVEMKNDFTSGQLFTNDGATGEAATYCNNLVVGIVTGWRLPTISELTGLSSMYSDGQYTNYFLVDAIYYHWSSTAGGNGYHTSKFTSATADFNGTGVALRVVCVKSLP